MSLPRARLTVMAAVLGLVAVLGVVWLVRSATTGSENSVGGEGTISSAATRDGTATATATNGSGTADDGATSSGEASGGTGAASDGTATKGSRTPDGGETHNGGRRSVRLNGVRIDGAGHGEGCVTLDNRTSTPATLESVSFVVTKGPGRPAVLSDNAAHCSRDQDSNSPCTRLLPIGRQCLAGAVIAPGAPQGEYTVKAVVHSAFLCDNDKISPCNDVRDWEGPLPTPKAPVLVRSSKTTRLLETTVDVAGAKPPTPDDSPDDSPIDSPPEQG
ncbi:hypothetical protein ACIO93_21375 [Streptomyces sp. NPDC087903]|uniref:hypothetical protein n=1 Tax=Streptomyces sp. NPDC087903 TaxID=3365819 RepID=UPI0037FC2376